MISTSVVRSGAADKYTSSKTGHGPGDARLVGLAYQAGLTPDDTSLEPKPAACPGMVPRFTGKMEASMDRKAMVLPQERGGLIRWGGFPYVLEVRRG